METAMIVFLFLGGAVHENEHVSAALELLGKHEISAIEKRTYSLTVAQEVDIDGVLQRSLMTHVFKFARTRKEDPGSKRTLVTIVPVGFHARTSRGDTLIREIKELPDGFKPVEISFGTQSFKDLPKEQAYVLSYVTGLFGLTATRDEDDADMIRLHTEASLGRLPLASASVVNGAEGETTLRLKKPRSGAVGRFTGEISVDKSGWPISAELTQDPLAGFAGSEVVVKGNVAIKVSLTLK